MENKQSAQTTLGFVLIGVVLVVWMYFFAPQPQQPVEDPNVSDSVKTEQPEQNVSQNDNQLPVKQIDDSEVINLPKNLPVDSSAIVAKESIITVENELARIEFTSKGARVRRVFLKKYKTWYSGQYGEDAPFYKKEVQLVNSKVDGGDLNVVFTSVDGNIINTKNFVFNQDAKSYHMNVAKDDSLVVSYKLPFGENSYIERTYTIYGNDYQMQTDVQFVNMKNVVAGSNYDIQWEHGINFVEKNSHDEANFANASFYVADDQIVIDATDEDEPEKKSLSGKIDWIAMKNKYFAFIMAPVNPTSDWGAEIEGERVVKQNLNKDQREIYYARYKVPFVKRNNQKDVFNLYFGPVKYDRLSVYGNNYESIYDFGSFFGLKFIIRPISEYVLLPFFNFLHSFIPNYGWVIVVFSIFIKILLYPLTRQTYLSSKKMKLLQPKIKEIKEKYPDDAATQQKETMALYSKYGFNPAGGCLPMFLQMPILFALFGLFRVAIEIRNEPFILWIDNLAAPDIILDLGMKIPFIGVSEVSGLALLLGITMFMTQKMTIQDPNQKQLVYIMPVVFTFMFMSFPSGLNLYYFMFNLISVVQQQIVNRSSKGNELVEIDPKNRKKGFMQRLMEQAETQKARQEALDKPVNSPRKKRKRK